MDDMKTTGRADPDGRLDMAPTKRRQQWQSVSGDAGMMGRRSFH